MTEADYGSYSRATSCHICNSPFTRDADGNFKDKVRDHDHLSLSSTSNYLGAAHAGCNLKRRTYERIPLFCHNAKNYDSHFIIRALFKNDQKKRINHVDGLAESTEKMKTLEINNFYLLDSRAFLNCSLDQLAKDLNKIPNFPYRILDQLQLHGNDSEKRDLLLCKGVYPYEYITSFTVYEDTVLPEKEQFFSKLHDSHLCEKDYLHAKTVFSRFGCRNLADYTKLYCIVDTCLLAEIMLNFRDEIYCDMGLDVCKYISLPQLSLDCALKREKLRLELMTDIDQLLFVENNIRGGLSFVNQRHAEKTETKDLLYLDFNNLYGGAMSQLLPYGDFRWLSPEEITCLNWVELPRRGC
jgi:hypothetical protein